MLQHAVPGRGWMKRVAEGGCAAAGNGGGNRPRVGEINRQTGCGNDGIVGIGQT